jgi:hypothetical protein
MRDTYRRYRAIATALLQLYHPRPTGHAARHLATLVHLICGIVGARHTHLPKIVEHTPGGKASDESRIKRFGRWMQREQVTEERWMLPVARALLATLASRPLELVFDGSVVGRGCLALMVSVVYYGRALPLVWVVIKGKKGHFPEDTHCALLRQVQALMPQGAQVTVLGDGEFDGINFQAALQTAGWHYVCRTACDTLLFAGQVRCSLRDLQPSQGTAYAVLNAFLTAKRYGPLTAIVVWDEGYDEPLYLVTNMDDLEAALSSYRKRGHIETFFSDQKSRGFQLHKSHLSDPARLSRLLIAACIAYIWIVYLGVWARQDEWIGRIHRRHRCDLSLFQLGLRFLSYCLRHRHPLPRGLLVPALLPDCP